MKVRSPVLGFNHNVRHRGRLFHVQTEDSGVQNPHIFTHLFHGGTIIHTKKVDYDKTLGEMDVKGLMQAQHKMILRELKKGKHDEKIVKYLGAHPEASSAESAEGAALPEVDAPVIELIPKEADRTIPMDAPPRMTPPRSKAAERTAHTSAPTLLATPALPGLPPRAGSAPPIASGTAPTVATPAAVPPPPAVPPGRPAPRPSSVLPPVKPSASPLATGAQPPAAQAAPPPPAPPPPAPPPPAPPASASAAPPTRNTGTTLPKVSAPNTQQGVYLSRPGQREEPFARGPSAQIPAQAAPGASRPATGPSPPLSRPATGPAAPLSRPATGPAAPQSRTGNQPGAGMLPRPGAPVTPGQSARPREGAVPTPTGVPSAPPRGMVASGAPLGNHLPPSPPSAPRPAPKGGNVVARPPVMIAGQSAGPPRKSPTLPSTAAAPAHARESKPSSSDSGIFGQGLISERSLDEVILAYLSEDTPED